MNVFFWKGILTQINVDRTFDIVSPTEWIVWYKTEKISNDKVILEL